jgi:predicted aspartyl protease
MLDVWISNPISGKPIPERGKIDTAADLTRVPERLKDKLEPLKKISEWRIEYGDGQVERHPTYLTTLHINDYKVDAEVYFRPSNYILIGLNVLNQLKLFADGKNQVFTVEDP